MTLLTEPETILKTDSRGRVRVAAERQEALLDEFERSGMSGRAFSRYIGVHQATFARWVALRRKHAGLVVTTGSAPKPLQLIEATAMPAQAACQPMAIAIGEVARVEVTGPEQLPMVAELIRLVAARTGAKEC